MRQRYSRREPHLIPLCAGSLGVAGAIRLTTDGTRFDSIVFPESVDLAGVRATSGTSAVVTTADGRAFRTDDRGATWADATVECLEWLRCLGCLECLRCNSSRTPNDSNPRTIRTHELNLQTSYYPPMPTLAGVFLLLVAASASAQERPVPSDSTPHHDSWLRERSIVRRGRSRGPGEHGVGHSPRAAIPPVGAAQLTR